MVNAFHEKHKQGVSASIQQEKLRSAIQDRIPTCTVNCAKTAVHSFTHERAYYVRGSEDTLVNTAQPLPPVISQSSGAGAQTGKSRGFDTMEVGCAGEILGYLGTPAGILEQEKPELTPQGGVGVNQENASGCRREWLVITHEVRVGRI